MNPIESIASKHWIEILILLASYPLCFWFTSFLVKRLILSQQNSDPQDKHHLDLNPNNMELRMGKIIGKCENIIILTLIYVGQFTGLALVFAAKNIARQKAMSENASFYLAGTMINFTASLGLAVSIKYLLLLFFS